jgi:salicylate hydroxylase
MNEASSLGVEILLSAEVSSVDFDCTEVVLSDGRVVQGDVIVGADGLWSAVRPLLLNSPSPPVETGDLAYRGTFTREQLLALGDSRIEELCSRNEVNCWIGPGRHCVFYPVRGGSSFNLVLLRPDNLPTGSRTAQGDIEEMRDTFCGWDETYVLFLTRPICSRCNWSSYSHQLTLKTGSQS